MFSAVIFENNVTSEVLLKSYFVKSKIKVYRSFNKKEENFMFFIKRYEPDFIVIEYELYKKRIYDIISDVKKVVPVSKIIITADKLSESESRRLKSFGASNVFLKPFIDTQFFRVLA